MVRLTRIYTRGGDGGETSLGDGSRVPKHALRVAAYGTVDEANAAIGIARLHADPEADEMLGRIQNDLFDLGADLCTPEDGRRAAGALRIAAAQVERLEREIDAMNASLRPLDSFILPGGTAAAAHLHLARTVTRRAERRVSELARTEAVNPEAAPRERLRQSVEALTEFLARHPGVCSGMLGAMGSAGRLAEALAVNEAVIAGPLRELIAAGVAAGEVVAPDPVDAANAVLGALLLGVLGRAMQGQDPGDVAVRQRLVAQVLRGVGVEP